MRTSGSSFLPDHNFLLMQRYNRPWKMLPLSSSGPSAGKNIFFQANEGTVIPFIIVITPLVVYRDWIHEMHFQLFSSITSTSYKSLSVLRFGSTFSIFFSRSWQNSSTKGRGGHDIRFGRSPMFICDFETQYFCARAVAYTPCNDHWRANVLICGQWVWYGTPFRHSLVRLQRAWLSSSVLMFLGELLGLLTNFYWSSQRTSSNWLAWELSQCTRLTSGTRFHLRLKAAYLSLSLKLSLRATFCKYHE